MRKARAISILCSVAFAIGSAAPITQAAATTSPTKGERLLQETINVESARSATLSVKQDATTGIVHTLTRTSTGNDVKLLQQFLKSQGVYPEGMVTGYFGALTEQAVKNFQKKESIDPVGIVGPLTRARMKEVSGKNVKAAQEAFFAAATSTTASIADAVLATDTAENGAALAPVTSVASTTQNIYAVLALQNVPQNAELAYIRYYGGTYVDSGVSHPSRSNLKYFHFQWSKKSGANRTVGNYSIIFYLNGKSVKTIQYTIY